MPFEETSKSKRDRPRDPQHVNHLRWEFYWLNKEYFHRRMSLGPIFDLFPVWNSRRRRRVVKSKSTKRALRWRRMSDWDILIVYLKIVKNQTRKLCVVFFSSKLWNASSRGRVSFETSAALFHDLLSNIFYSSPDNGRSDFSTRFAFSFRAIATMVILMQMLHFYSSTSGRVYGFR